MYLLIRDFFALKIKGNSNLHPNMYLLIPPHTEYISLSETDLHPNMYLLIRISHYMKHGFQYLFTSQHVSINSYYRPYCVYRNNNLHPNMYLLILKQIYDLLMKQYNLHPNMYLLIPVAAVSPVGASEKFTSQHVSINSQIAIQISNCNQYLHPNMYLLILIH